MFTVEIRTNQPWQVRSKRVEPRRWVSISKKSFTTKKQAEEEVAYLTMNFEDVGHLLNNFKIDYRISESGKVLWEKHETYNRRA